MAGNLKVLVAGSEPARTAALEQRLRALSDAVVVSVPSGGSFGDAVTAASPDVIVVDVGRPDRDRLVGLRRINADDPKPIVMFVAEDDDAFMEEAIAAGVCSYTVADAAFPDLKPILMGAVAIFRKHQKTVADLRQAQAALLERETINRAKALLMRQRKLAEPQAYRWLQRRAMNENKRIADIAAALLECGVD